MLADESTKQYKQEQKEMGIKKGTDEIILKAKRDQHKIETFKQKLRQSVMGGVISNNLSSIAQQINDKNQKLQISVQLIQKTDNLVQVEDDVKFKTDLDDE